MTEHSFSLIPFPNLRVPDIIITGKASRRDTVLSIEYLLRGAYENILFPDPSPHPARKDDLWKASCFEFFIAIPRMPDYWEFNMSPSGDWNVYRMDAYRRVGFREEPSFQQLPFTIQRGAACVSIDVSIDMGSIVPPTDPVQLGITSILQTKDGIESYWALVHPGTQADFHLRESFVIEL